MPVFNDIRTCDQFAPYLSLAPSPDSPPPPTGEFRNVFFLGWGIGYEQYFLIECDLTPTHLRNLVVRANGQDMYKEVNPLDPKCSKILISKLIFLLTSRLDLGHVVDQYHGGSHTLYLQNAGNDSHWELWATLKAIRQGLGLLHSDSAGMSMREAYFTISWDDPDEVINPRDFA